MESDNQIHIDAALVSALETLAIQFTEPGLDNLLVSAGTFFSCTTKASAAAETQASIILVPTPSDPINPEFSSSYVEKACEALGEVLRSRASWRYHLIVVASTLYPGTMTSRISLQRLNGRLDDGRHGFWISLHSRFRRSWRRRSRISRASVCCHWQRPRCNAAKLAGDSIVGSYCRKRRSER